MIYGLCSELSSLTLDFEMMWFSSNWKEKTLHSFLSAMHLYIACSMDT